MPGGALHSPVWAPYKLYGQVDYMYGWPAWEARNGFTAAQAWLNLAETGGWSALLFLWIIPNGAWLVFPSYMIYVFGQEILQGLEIASGEFKAAKDR
ncbi:MAG: Emopamil-binding [Lasallia pustulata]|uniref:Emopamil-binding n=1 Tax=Lasallia pustulata TaxID=136370 RepID=A0A5M8PF38_9LECA|nr:MAG: Emopamil-binding [Lasallia pustulata]